MDLKRKIIILSFFSVCIICLAARVFYLQIIDGERLSQAASSQRMSGLGIDKQRGDIVDKNLIPFTNRDKKVLLALKPFFLKDNQEEVDNICGLLGLDSNLIYKEIEEKSEPILIEINDNKKKLLSELNFNGISFISSLKRYGYDSLAKHVIGYLNKKDQVGATGIEGFYEKALMTKSEEQLSVINDARSRFVQGMGYRLVKPGEKSKKLNVQLTLDYHIQKIVEEVMNEENIIGAVVIEDVSNGDILAIASKPDYDPNDITSYLENSRNPLFNRAVAAYNLGSIFKVIDLAVMFESGITMEENYFCPGFIKIGDKEYRCSSFERGGHGNIDTESAFALSCNPYFISAGIKAGGKRVLEMAKRFGYGSVTGVKEQGMDEASGVIPELSKVISDGDIANISIGQGDILATPLQVTDMMATVANGGIRNKVNLVDGIVDADGNRIRNIRSDAGNRIISKDIADRIKELLEKAVCEGTGKKADISRFGGAAGKTGSAETGQFDGDNKVIQAWFAGYFPVNDPKYAMTVFVENGKTGGEAAAPVFAKIAERIVQKGILRE